MSQPNKQTSPQDKPPKFRVRKPSFAATDAYASDRLQEFGDQSFSYANHFRTSPSAQSTTNEDQLHDHRRQANPKKKRTRTKQPKLKIRRPEARGNGTRSLEASTNVNNSESPLVTGPATAGYGSTWTSHGVFADMEVHDVNNPPSRPASPGTGSLAGVEERDPAVPDELEDSISEFTNSRNDVCLPDVSETGSQETSTEAKKKRHFPPPWPDLKALREGLELDDLVLGDRAVGMRSIVEPLKVNNRFRPTQTWSDMPRDRYRITYFNDSLKHTIHSNTISGLTASEKSFEELFKPAPRKKHSPLGYDEDEYGEQIEYDGQDQAQPELSPTSSPNTSTASHSLTTEEPAPNESVPISRATTRASYEPVDRSASPHPLGAAVAAAAAAAASSNPYPRPGRSIVSDFEVEPPTFWLDVLEPTPTEMEALRRAFRLHRLTVEDIEHRDAREKVELFNHYYFVNYCSFEQDTESEDFMEPVNIYAVVFRQGVLTFHWSRSPHLANVRRRIRVLSNYIRVSADWISYALIDDITDSYGPLVESVKDEVEELDEAILKMHSILDKPTSVKVTDKWRPRNRGRGESSSVSLTSAPVNRSWTGAVLNRLRLRRKRRPSECNSSASRGDPENGSSHTRSSSIALTRTQSGPNEGPSSRPGPKGLTSLRSAYRNWHPVRRQGDEKSDSSSVVGSRVDSDADLLIRVGECRKKVMSLLRLLGHKADVIKSFAKRCNEQSLVTPHSEIGMYLGDIQDHLVTMTTNLGHYEILLSRTHSNYLAQINIRMTQRAESTNDVLNKLTVLGTIVLPMNIITGMWGMNVLVPGQGNEDSLAWFWSITAGLAIFGLVSFFIAKKTYGIV